MNPHGELIFWRMVYRVIDPVTKTVRAEFWTRREADAFVDGTRYKVRADYGERVVIS